MSRIGAAVLIGLIRTYQAVVSPWVTQQCKYYPSCSAYGLEAVRTHGALRGARLAVARVVRCNPWSDGGVDYVPGTPDQIAYDRATLAEPSTLQPAPLDPARI